MPRKRLLSHSHSSEDFLCSQGPAESAGLCDIGGARMHLVCFAALER